MPTEDIPTYRKFSKLRKSLFRGVQLWAAEDHLLLVTSIFAFESYRRFYFQDIEALILRRTPTQRTWVMVNSIGLVVFASLCVWLALSSRGRPNADEAGRFIVVAVLTGFFGFLFLIGLIWQLVLGPSCVVFLQMRNGLEKLDNYDRLRAAEQMRARLAQTMAEKTTEPVATP